MPGAHWNPRMKKVIIHPGGQRFFIFNLFPIRDIQYIFWNTNGIQLDFMKDMEEVDVESLYPKYKHSPGGLTFDHGSIIPHPLHEVSYSLNENVEDSFEQLKNEIKDKGGRPREGNTYGKDKHPYGRDPLGNKENERPNKRETRTVTNAKKLAREYINGISSKKVVLNEKSDLLDEKNLLDDTKF
jgi:hypothetical protein